MAVVYNRRDSGLYTNGLAQYGTNSYFTSYALYTASALSGTSSFAVLTNVYGTEYFGNEYVPVDTTKTYQHAVSVRTIQNNYLGNPGSGHLGFATYDSQKRFIDLRNCGDIGNTTLSRDLNPGDAYVYLTTYANISNSTTGWVTGASVTSTSVFSRHVLFFPSAHPEFNQPWKYTRIGFGDYNIYYKSMTLTVNGDWELKICNQSDIDAVMPNIGYSTPAGTPVSRGVVGSTYNYCHGAPNYPVTWTTYVTAPFTGESRSSDVPFRYATKFIRFLNLVNYNYRTENAGDSARYALDNIMLVQCPGGARLPNSFFSRGDIL